MEGKNKVNSNIQVGIYVVVFVIVGLVIMGAIWCLYNKNKLTEEEQFVVEAISDYQEFLSADEDSDFELKEIRLYKENEGYEYLVLFHYTYNSEKFGNFNEKFGYVKLIDGKIEKLSDFIDDSKLVNSLTKVYWGMDDYTSIDTDKIIKHIRKK